MYNGISSFMLLHKFQIFYNTESFFAWRSIVIRIIKIIKYL